MIKNAESLITNPDIPPPISVEKPKSQGNSQLPNQSSKFLLLLILGLLSIGLIILAFFISKTSPLKTLIPSTPSISEKIKIIKFKSEEDFKSYLQSVEKSTSSSSVSDSMRVPTAALEGKTAIGDFAQPVPGRVSETNVQVRGIDEPDIVKTDGIKIYTSTQSDYYRPLPIQSDDREMTILPPERLGGTNIINAFPPTELSKNSQIQKTGNLFLEGKTLVIFSTPDILGYDVTNPISPTEKWKITLEDNNSFLTARLYNGKIYLLTKTTINKSRPCPIRPLTVGGVSLDIECTQIYYPSTRVQIDSTYTASIIDPSTGKTNKSVSFVGSSASSVIYMSENSIFITYSYFGDFVKYLHDFFVEEGQDLVPDYVVEKIKKLQSYDISNTSKIAELQIILENYNQSLPLDEQRRIENEINNRMEDYAKRKIRDLERTGIVKINLSDFQIATTGTIPGRPLNQFSLDEYQGFLRIATTVGSTRSMFGATESANDIYVLNNNLDTIGSISNLGFGEKIYSARFIEDKGYLVTFKQIDPFFVLDLSDPKNPIQKGELKIPGYSSYLHPITKDKILGVGKEGSQVKLSLFDVSSPDNPIEISKYKLDDYWSDILDTHHAFLLDTKHQVFFMPGAKGGYVFSYEKGELELVKVVSNILAKRSIYINDFLYIIGEDKLVVLSEADWHQINQLDL